MPAPMISITEALASRRSVRAFLKKEVPGAIVRHILEHAARAPSSGNIQPWQVIVLTGEALHTLSGELCQKFLSGDTGKPDYDYYPVTWSQPYISRRRKVGYDLYESLGIGRQDKEAKTRQMAQNFCFFGAPVGLLFTLDRSMGTGNWIDLGLFMQSIMLAARAYGLDTCPQASFADYHDYISQRLAIPADRQLINGMALGYGDSAAAVNGFSTERASVDDFTRFVTQL